MGLDISYYKIGEKVEVDENIETWSEEFHKEYGHDLIWLYSNYEMEQSDDLDGFYRSERLGGFRAGSYSGYSNYRDMLRRLSIVAMAENKELSEKYNDEGIIPFNLQLDFSDCEGFIGPFSSVTLRDQYRDFYDPIIKGIIKMAKYGVKPEIYKTIPKESLEYFAELYNEWKTAFEKSANVGVVYYA